MMSFCLKSNTNVISRALCSVKYLDCFIGCTSHSPHISSRLTHRAKMHVFIFICGTDFLVPRAVKYARDALCESEIKSYCSSLIPNLCTGNLVIISNQARYYFDSHSNKGGWCEGCIPCCTSSSRKQQLHHSFHFRKIYYYYARLSCLAMAD